MFWKVVHGTSESQNFGAVGLFHATVAAGETEVSLWLEDDESFWLAVETHEGSWSAQVFVPVFESDVIEWITALALGLYAQRSHHTIQLERRRLRLSS